MHRVGCKINPGAREKGFAADGQSGSRKTHLRSRMKELLPAPSRKFFFASTVERRKKARPSTTPKRIPEMKSWNAAATPNSSAGAAMISAPATVRNGGGHHRPGL